MVIYITVLRFLACCLITNSHYTGIYPTDIIANGGLLGDVLFFAVSGFCLWNIKKGFVRWYANRIIRCYLPILIATGVFLLLGAYSFTAHSLAWWLLWPTGYHFVASIIILYIPYYIIARTAWLRSRLPYLMIAAFVVYLLLYGVLYDKSYYHIDTVREPMILFIYFESMLLGAWFREKDAERRNAKLSAVVVISGVISFVTYFAGKLLFSHYEELSSYQFVNQILLFVLLYFFLRIFASLDRMLGAMPRAVHKGISFVADMTLEVYAVQSVLISWLKPFFGFPLNWLVITSAILASAAVLHFLCKKILDGADSFLRERSKNTGGR